MPPKSICSPHSALPLASRSHSVDIEVRFYPSQLRSGPPPAAAVPPLRTRRFLSALRRSVVILFASDQDARRISTYSVATRVRDEHYPWTSTGTTTSSASTPAAPARSLGNKPPVNRSALPCVPYTH